MDPLIFAGVAVSVIFVISFGVELATGRIQRSSRPWRDAGFSAMGILAHATLSGSFLGMVVGFLVTLLWPDGAGSLAQLPFWSCFLVLFVSQEFMHYWLHRCAHEWRWLWKIHRTHHTAESLNVGVIYRYNVFWVLLVPQTWVGAIATYFGQGEAFVAAIMVTYVVNILTHSNYRWDLWLREKMPWSEPVWRVLEQVVTLPDAHHAHHAYGKGAHPNGNYAITIFAFDRMFGTAKIVNQRQTQYGLPIAKRLHWGEELFWPLIRKPLLPKPASNKG